MSSLCKTSSLSKNENGKREKERRKETENEMNLLFVSFNPNVLQDSELSFPLLLFRRLNVYIQTCNLLASHHRFSSHSFCFYLFLLLLHCFNLFGISNI